MINNGEHPLFETFISACGKVSKNLKQTLLASLAPPKISAAARFMNIHRLVAWADQLLKHSPRGSAAEGSMLAKLRNSLEELPSCKTFIKQFLRDAVPLLKCQEILKNKGLNLETHKKSEELISALPVTSPIRIGFSNWAEEHLAIATALKLETIGMPISSDSIESSFGVGKRLGTGPVKDADRIAARLPVFCGTFTEDDARKVLGVSVEQQKQIFKEQSSLTKQRRDVLPHPGTLETLAQSPERQNMELIMNFTKTEIMPTSLFSSTDAIIIHDDVTKKSSKFASQSPLTSTMPLANLTNKVVTTANTRLLTEAVAENSEFKKTEVISDSDFLNNKSNPLTSELSVNTSWIFGLPCLYAF